MNPHGITGPPPRDLAAFAEYNAGVTFSRLQYEAEQHAETTCARGHNPRPKGTPCLPCRAMTERRYRERRAS